MVIFIRDYTNSDTAISYEDGKRCLDDILNYIENDVVTLDFKGINFVITAFLNPVIGDLILQKGPSVMQKISINNASNAIIEKIVLVRDGALLKREGAEED